MFTTAGRQCSPVAPLTTIGQDYVARPMRQTPKTKSGAEIGASKSDTCNHTYIRINTHRKANTRQRRRVHITRKQTSGDTCVLEVDNDAQIKGTTLHLGDAETRRTTQYLHQQVLHTCHGRRQKKTFRQAVMPHAHANPETHTHTHTLHLTWAVCFWTTQCCCPRPQSTHSEEGFPASPRYYPAGGTGSGVSGGPSSGPTLATGGHLHATTDDSTRLPR